MNRQHELAALDRARDHLASSWKKIDGAWVEIFSGSPARTITTGTYISAARQHLECADRELYPLEQMSLSDADKEVATPMKAAQADRPLIQPEKHDSGIVAAVCILVLPAMVVGAILWQLAETLIRRVTG